MTVDESLNIARVAIHKYFIDAQSLPSNAEFKDIKPSRDAAIDAIKQFSATKKAHGEKYLTPYEERSLESFDAAETMMKSKIHITKKTRRKIEKELYGGDCCGCC
jgi:hypothetical protein